MDIIFANPAGFWALLGVPVILAIHFFQRESRSLIISTLFLVKQISPESIEGRRLDRLRNSLLLWLQILAVILLAWLLAQPRWLRQDSVQSVVLVLDSSSSMEAFRQKLPAKLRAELGRLAATASRTEWTLLESDTRRGTLYAGDSLDALLAAVEKWKPRLGTHDFSAALRQGQELVRKKGILVLVTDHRPEVPEGVEVLAVGAPVENCGFAGVRLDRGPQGVSWEALMRNYGRTAQSRRWWMESGTQKGEVQSLILQPGEIYAARGALPAGVESAELVLEPDEFGLDDRLPVLSPKRKVLLLGAAANPAFTDFFARIVSVLEDVEPAPAGSQPDFVLAAFDPNAGKFPAEPGIIFLQESGTSKNLFPGLVVGENHPLVAGLNWRGLVAGGTQEIFAKPEDEVLLWQGDRPLAFIRNAGRGRQLVFNFDPRLSNAERLPGFILLVHRFLEATRSQKVGFETANVDTRQLLSVAAQPLGPPVTLKPGDEGDAEAPASQVSLLRAPAEPKFFEVSQGATPLLRGAAHFGDAREADLSGAESYNTVEKLLGALAERNSREDFLAPLWMLLFVGVLLGGWFIQGRRKA